MGFCTQCGKKLNDGEVCNCQEQQVEVGNGFTGQGFAEETYAQDAFAGQSFDTSEPQFTEQSDNVASEQEAQGTAEQSEAVTIDVGELKKNTKNAWVMFKNRVGIGEPDTNENHLYERGMDIVPDSIEANEGEFPIKQYNFAVLRTRLSLIRAEGRLQVTNKRVLFRATGRSFMGRTVFQHEFAIEEIAGIEVKKDHKPSFLNLLGAMLVSGLLLGIMFKLLMSIYMESYIFGNLISAVLGVASIYPFYNVYKKFVWKFLALSAGFPCGLLLILASQGNKVGGFISMVLCMVIAITWLMNLYILFFIPSVEMTIKVKGGLPAIQVKRGSTGFAEILPWEDTDIVITELGAMVEDIQNFGDAGIAKWKK